MISANMVSPSCSKFCQLKRKKNFAQSASDGTAGECSVMFYCKFSSQNRRQQQLRLAVSSDYISANGLRFPRLPTVTLLLRHVIRCHSAVPAKMPKAGDSRWRCLRLSQKESWECGSSGSSRHQTPRNLLSGGLAWPLSHAF